MNVVIQCAAAKRSGAGFMLRRDGTRVLFVSDPSAAPRASDVVYARPDDPAEGGLSWREVLAHYNRSAAGNPFQLLRAIELYRNPVYKKLEEWFGIEKLFILSAGWGLIPAEFLTPVYDITFSRGAEIFKRRRRSDAFQDFRQLPAHTEEPLVFLGGKDYVPLFASLTAGFEGRRIVFCNSVRPPLAPGCELLRFETSTRTNWHYACAQALIDGRVDLSG